MAWGDVLPWLAAGLFILAAAWSWLTRAARKAGRPRSAASIAVGLAAAVLALVVAGATIVVGHTGATAAWGDVEGTGQSADQVPASTAPAAPKPSHATTTSPHGSPSTRAANAQSSDCAARMGVPPSTPSTAARDAQQLSSNSSLSVRSGKPDGQDGNLSAQRGRDDTEEVDDRAGFPVSRWW